MIINTLTLDSADYPSPLRELHRPPKQLFHLGAALHQLLGRPRVTIVGSRKLSPYGHQVTVDLAGKLAEQGVVIISGLAIGVDALAHETALEAGGLCIAVLPSALDNILPVQNRRLAAHILDNGGALISEYPPGQPAFKQNFIARNRIMSGLGQVLLVTEASEKSGTTHTANFAIEQGRTVMAVPGKISDPNYFGCNNLIKSGAGLVNKVDDVLHALGITPHKTSARHVRGRNANEQKLLDLMLEGISDGEELLIRAALDVSEFNQALTMLEISSKIRPLGANQWAIF